MSAFDGMARMMNLLKPLDEQVIISDPYYCFDDVEHGWIFERSELATDESVCYLQSCDPFYMTTH